MSAVSRILPVILVVLVAPVVHAAFPYNADWLNYADKRIVYQLDVSNVGTNEPDIFVSLTIDTQTLQDFIDRWDTFCDEAGRYDWFYPTFTYASTANTAQRMLKVIEYKNWQTFTVGSCGSVSLPTEFTLQLPNALDGEEYFQGHTHYIFAYLKYPYTDDFYDNPVGFPPEEYNIDDGDPHITYNSEFGKGHTLNYPHSVLWYPREISADLSKPLYYCYHTCAEYGAKVAVVLPDGSEEVFDIPRSGSCRYAIPSCMDISSILRARGYSGTQTLKIRPSCREGWSGWAYLYYVWIIPQQVYDKIIYGKE